MHKDLNIQEKETHKIFAILSENNGTIDIVLNRYNQMPSSIIQLVRQTNRFLLVGEKYKIPILYQMDQASSAVKSEKLPYLPYGGYLISINYSGSVVIQEAILF
ncbi:MAG: hypothetical protein AB8B69_04665 [Chitinophagales bacterium]